MESTNHTTNYVLILGGSSFMGLDLLEDLSLTPNCVTYMINRGKNYWYETNPVFLLII